MRYQLVVINNDIEGPLSNREHVFIPLFEEWTVVEAGAGWLGRYPNDIAMLVEVPE